jgi:hypothetical protein
MIIIVLRMPRAESSVHGIAQIRSNMQLSHTNKSYTDKKTFLTFPSQSGMSLTKLSLGGNNDVIYKLFPPRESLESDIPAEDGNIEKLFLRCKGTISRGK